MRYEATLNVNGVGYPIEIEPGRSLLSVLQRSPAVVGESLVDLDGRGADDGAGEVGDLGRPARAEGRVGRAQGLGERLDVAGGNEGAVGSVDEVG